MNRQLCEQAIAAIRAATWGSLSQQSVKAVAALQAEMAREYVPMTDGEVVSIFSNACNAVDKTELPYVQVVRAIERAVLERLQ